MSDTSSSSPEASDGAEGTKDAPDGKDKADKKDDEPKLSKTEQEAIDRRDSALAKARKEKEAREAAEAKLAEANAKLQELDDLKRKAADDDAAAKGNIEAIRKSAADTEATLKGRIAELEAEVKKVKADAETEVASLKNTYLLEAEVMRTISEVTVDPQLVWLLLGSKFELTEGDDGRLRPQVKDSTLDIKTYVERTLEETNRANLLKSQRKAGTGTEPAPTDSKGATKLLTPEQIAKLPDKGKEYFRKNPEAARQYAADRVLGK